MCCRSLLANERTKDDKLLVSPYQGYSKKYAYSLTALFALLLIAPFLIWPVGPHYFLIAALIIVLIAPLESLLLTPLYTITGRFNYLSPLLLATNSTTGIELHVGTLYDYANNLRKRDCGKRAQHIVLKHIFEGLLNTCKQIEVNEIARDTELSATSYFFSSKTAEKLGFKLTKTSKMEQFNLFSVYISLVIRLSFTRGRLTLPRVSEIKKITITADELLKRQEVIKSMLSLVESRIMRD